MVDHPAHRYIQLLQLRLDYLLNIIGHEVLAIQVSGGLAVEVAPGLLDGMYPHFGVYSQVHNLIDALHLDFITIHHD